MNNFYELPKLNYKLNELEPVISERLLTLHYSKHHQKYVDDANTILKQLDMIKGELTTPKLDMKSLLKSLSFNIGGIVLHNLFWANMRPLKESNNPSESFSNVLSAEFGSFERFKEIFNNTALSVEGSGWGALAYCKMTGRLLLMQIEKHNVNIYPMFQLLLVLDVWEHSYYLDYENNRQKFIESFWSIVNWDEVENRYQKLRS